MTGRLQNGSRRLKPVAVFERDLPRPTAVTTERGLLTTSWTADVEILETAIGQFAAEQPLSGDCQVVMFEMAGDHQLHVNVVHQRSRTAVVRGWAGPGRLPVGCVYNRRFDGTPAGEMIRRIRDVVFA